MSAKHKEIIEKVNAGFEKNDPEVFLSFCNEDIKWTMAGDTPKQGKQSVRDWINSMGDDIGPPKINSTAVISEGNNAACYGDMTMREKGEDNKYSFCDVYTFDGDKIAELRSFAVKESPAGKTASA
jgi:ketosteroid isomerase-like protein